MFVELENIDNKRIINYYNIYLIITLILMIFVSALLMLRTLDDYYETIIMIDEKEVIYTYLDISQYDYLKEIIIINNQRYKYSYKKLDEVKQEDNKYYQLVELNIKEFRHLEDNYQQAKILINKTNYWEYIIKIIKEDLWFN